MKSRKSIYLIISIVAIGIGVILSMTYRPFIYEKEIFDFGLADTIGSLVSVVAVCFLFWSFKPYSNREKNKHIIYVVLAFTLIWEPMGLIGVHGTFDWKDIIATFISGLLTLLLKYLVDKKHTVLSIKNKVNNVEL